MTFFRFNFELYSCIFAAPAFWKERLVFGKSNCHVTLGWGGGGHPMNQGEGGGGGKIGQKSVTYYLTGHLPCIVQNGLSKDLIYSKGPFK